MITMKYPFELYGVQCTLYTDIGQYWFWLSEYVMAYEPWDQSDQWDHAYHVILTLSSSMWSIIYWNVSKGIGNITEWLLWERVDYHISFVSKIYNTKDDGRWRMDAFTFPQSFNYYLHWGEVVFRRTGKRGID